MTLLVCTSLKDGQRVTNSCFELRIRRHCDSDVLRRIIGINGTSEDTVTVTSWDGPLNLIRFMLLSQNSVTTHRDRKTKSTFDKIFFCYESQAIKKKQWMNSKKQEVIRIRIAVGNLQTLSRYIRTTGNWADCIWTGYLIVFWPNELTLTFAP